MANYSANDIADWFLSRDEMSPKKLQKLIYYAYAWTLVFHNDSSDELDNKLFDEPIEAWVHGPVVRELYSKYKPYGYNDIPKVTEVKSFPEDIEATLSEVWEIYGDFNGNQLESLTHSETPWIEAREGLRPMDSTDKKLDDKTIFEFYSKEVVA